MRRHCSWIASACALAAALVAGTAAGQDPRLTRLPPEAQATVGALVDSARAAGLPAEPLVQRALEGATKQAPGDLIVAAVQRLAADLGRARDALGSTASPAELSAGAAALRAGAPPAVLTKLRRARRQPVTMPLAVLTDLVASGVPMDSAAAAVLTLAARAGDADLVEFRRAVERDIALGAPPGTAAAAAAADAAATAALQVNARARGQRPGRP